MVILKIMGWRFSQPSSVAMQIDNAQAEWIKPDGSRCYPGSFRPSTDIAHAWIVLERLEALSRTVAITNGVFVPADQQKSTNMSMLDRWRAYFPDFGAEPQDYLTAWADTAPLVICRIAMKAVLLQKWIKAEAPA